MIQSHALHILKSGKSTFLTGPPGTGKTHVLNYFIDYLAAEDIPYAVTASTGIAASHIGGSTLHSFAGLGINNVIDQDFLKSLSKKRRVASRINTIEVLIIDEVSMLLPEVFSAVDQIMRHIRVSIEPFGGVQLVLTGDFFQLPPVQRVVDVGERYIWQTQLWRDADLMPCYLDERFRHSDQSFATILDEIRAGAVTEESQELLLSRVGQKDADEGSVTQLYTHNTHVDRINAAELAKIDTPAKRYVAQHEGREQYCEQIMKSTLIEPELLLKKGAHVIFTRNDRDGRFVNGTTGEVVDFDESSMMPIVQLRDGVEIKVQAEEWSRENEAGTTIASVRQLPLRLAWAMTIHKSQGMTLDRVHMDLSQCFETGQGYVALSRVRTLEGLSLDGINEVALTVDPLVGDFYKEVQKGSEEIEVEIVKEISAGTLDVLDALPPRDFEHKRSPVEKKPKIKTAEVTRDLIEKGLSITDAAKERQLARGTILDHLEKFSEEGWEIPFALYTLEPHVREEITDATEYLYNLDDENHFLPNGNLRLGSIYKHLNGKYSYDEIRETLLFI